MESSHTSGTTDEPQEDDLSDKIPTDRIGSRTENPPSPSTSKAQESDATGTTNNNASSHDHTEKNDLGTQCPPKQVMERSADEGDAKYRIPSHVFSRANTGNRMEWSTNSNESLFSIQMGNMSFTNDHLQWMSKSELFDLDPSIRPSMELPSNLQQSTARQSVELVDKKGGGKRIGDTEAAAAAAERMRQVIMENEGEKKSPPKLPEPADDKKPDHRNLAAEPTSFAFPILPGQVDKNASVSAWPNAKNSQQIMHGSYYQPSKDQPPPKQSNHVKLGSEKKQTISGDESSPNHKQAAAAAASSTTDHHVDQWRWPCFSCCPFR